MSDLVNPTISFDEIASDIARPQVIMEVAPRSTNSLIGYPARILVLAQADSGTVNHPYLITRDGQAESIFGPSSMMAQMVRAIRLANPVTPLVAMAQGTPAQGTAAATGNITFTAVPANGGSVPFFVADRYFLLNSLSGGTVTNAAAAAAAAVNADLFCPMAATAAAGVVTLTAKTPGTPGNGLRFAVGGLRGDETAPGFAWTLAQPSGGLGVPDVSAALAVITTEWYTDVVVGYTDAQTITLCNAESDRRFSARGHLDMRFTYAQPFSVGQALAASTASNNRFSMRLAYVGQTPPWTLAAVWGAVHAFQLTNDPARQLKGLALPGVLAPALLDRAQPDEREQLLQNGWSTFDVLSDGTMVVERSVTPWQFGASTGSGQVPDRAWRDIMASAVASRIRYDFIGYIATTYPRHKLADDDAPAALYSDVVATARRLQNSWAGRCGLYERLGWIEGARRTSALAQFVRDKTGPDPKNRVNARLVINRIGNLMVFAARLEFEV